MANNYQPNANPGNQTVSVALCMLVKNEAPRIAACLDPVVERLNEIIIIDTGSGDGTPELLKSRYGIEALSGDLQESRCYCHSDLRNHAFAMVQSDWILTLDADERIDPAGLDTFFSSIHQDEVAGYFGRWINHWGDGPVFEDYKLFLFRKGLRQRGLMHDNVQIDIRERGLRANWLDGLVVHHYPDLSMLPMKVNIYKSRLQCALRHEPDWARYHWFLGYMLFQAGDFEAAIPHLQQAARPALNLFPVEQLNSYMVIADILARQDLRGQLDDWLDEAAGVLDRVADDFEVEINFRLKPWFEAALVHARAGQLEHIRAYRFAR